MLDKLFISKSLFDEMLSHCREKYPNEACGILAGKGNEASNIYKMSNVESSPVSYFMDSKEQFRVMKHIRENNITMLAIYHSHPSAPAYPSQRDISLAFYDDAVYIIISLLGKEPKVKGYLILEGEIKEIGIAIKD